MGKIKTNIPSVGNADFDWSAYEDGWNGASLKVNTKIKTGDRHTKVYCHEAYAADLLNVFSGRPAPVSKELQKDTLVQITNFSLAGKDTVLAAINGGANNVVIDLNKEQKFFNTIAMGDGQKLTKESFIECLKDPEVRQAILNMGLVAKVGTDVEKASIWDGYVENLSNEMREQITKKSKAYVAKIVSSNNGGFVVEVADTVKAFMPGSMAAANKLTDYAALVGQTMEVMVESYDKKYGFVVSRKKYLHTIIPMYVRQLEAAVKENADTLFAAKITGTTPFGIFCELDGFGHCLTGMIHKSLMSDTLRDALRQGKVEAETTMNVYVHKVEKSHGDCRLIFSDVPTAEREAVIAKREAEDAAEKTEYVASKKEAAKQAATEAEAAEA